MRYQLEKQLTTLRWHQCYTATANKITDLYTYIQESISDVRDRHILAWRVRDNHREIVMSEEQVFQALDNARAKTNATV